jgi:hypothetical protein
MNYPIDEKIQADRRRASKSRIEETEKEKEREKKKTSKKLQKKGGNACRGVLQSSFD